MRVETLDDPIDVEVRFSQRGMRPLWFVWRGRRHPVQQVTGVWHEQDGSLRHRCFSVTDGDAYYELRFDARALRWFLTKVALAG